jgi:DNA polymerase III epsilon subunit-like protein
MSFSELREIDFVFGDTETTGRRPGYHELLEIGAVRLTNKLVEVRYFERKCKPEAIHLADPEALKVNRYSELEWRHAVALRVALLDYIALLDNRPYIFVGHSPHFDLDFLRAAFAKEAIKFPEPRFVIDLASMLWPLFQKGLLDKMSLDTACARYGIENTGHHRALPDARRGLALYKKIMGIA